MDASVHETDVCVVGGGPAGMLLGLLLAREGVRVLVLEQNEDFSREFRGEVLMPRFTRLFRRLGLEAVIEACPHRRLEALEIRGRVLRLARVPLAGVARDVPYALWTPQPFLLGALRDAASVFPAFEMWFDATARHLIQDGGRTAGAVVERGQRRVEVRARVVVGADGRFSAVKRLGGFATAYEAHDFDVIWFVIPDPQDGPGAIRAWVGPHGSYLAVPKHPRSIQCGMIEPPDGFRRWKDRGVEALRQHLLDGPPLIHAFARELRDFSPFHQFQATVHLVSTWAKDGVLLIGDAAHTCSPAGAVGVSIAVETAAVAAEVLARAIRSGDVSAAALGEVQRRREAEVRVVHRLQRRLASGLAARTPLTRGLAAAGIFLFGRAGLAAPLLRRLLSDTDFRAGSETSVRCQAPD